MTTRSNPGPLYTSLIALVACGADDSTPSLLVGTDGAHSTGLGGADSVDAGTGAPSSTGGGTASEGSSGVQPTSSTGAAADSSATDDGAVTTDGGTPMHCEAPGDLIPCDENTDDPFMAIGLGCAGDENQVIPLTQHTFVSPDAAAWRIVRQFGSHTDPDSEAALWSPREGQRLLALSTGRLPQPDEQGRLIVPTTAVSTDNDNQDGKPLPAPMTPYAGSNDGTGGTPFVNCDGVNDCSDMLGPQWFSGGQRANDLLWFQFETPVPAGTYGFSFDFALFSREYPNWIDTIYNDAFVVWSNSESYTGNVCFAQGKPCSVSGLWPVAYEEDAPELVGTGFEGQGGATGWFEAKASVMPGELLQLTWALFDTGNAVRDTVVLLDHWRWSCEGCTPGTGSSCDAQRL